MIPEEVLRSSAVILQSNIQDKKGDEDPIFQLMKESNQIMQYSMEFGQEWLMV